MAGRVCDEEEYLAMHGASRQGFGDSALHKNRARHSDRVWRSIVDRQAAKDTALAERREALRKEYQAKVASGELRPRTRIETLIQVAKGNSDRADVQAARRVLAKQGVAYT